MRPRTTIAHYVALALALFTLHARAQQPGGGGEEKLLLLPSYGYSDEQGSGIGANGAWLRLLGSPWDFTANIFASSVYEQTFINFNLINKHLDDDVLYFKLGGWIDRSTRSLFYGLSNDSSLGNASQYALRDSAVAAKLGVHILNELVTGITYGHRSISVDLGSDSVLPQFLGVYGTMPRASGTTTTAIGVFAQYDSRTPEYAPNAGDFYLVETDQAQPRPGEDLSRTKFYGEAEDFWSLLDKDVYLVTRARLQRVWGENVPFSLQSQLGNDQTLRGYRLNRYIDAGEFLLNIEPRWDFFETGGGVIERMELSFGLDYGRVYGDGLLPPLGGYHSDWDLGITGVLNGGIPLRLDYAFGPEGSLLYIHLFYPF